MAQAGAIRAGKAFVEIFADNNPLVKGLRAAEVHLEQWGATVRNAGLRMAALGGAILAPLYKGATAFGDFDEQMRKVSTQLKNPQEWMDAYSAGIRKLAVDFGEGTDTLSKGLYDILSASFAPAEAMDMLTVAVKAARGGMTDTATAVDGLTSVLNAYQLSAKDAGRVSDIMFASVLRGKMEFPDLAANIGKVAPMAKVAGMAIEDMMAALSTMTRQGLSTEEATTRLSNIIKQAPEAAKDIAGLIKKYVGASVKRIQLDFPEWRASSGIATLALDFKGLTDDIELMRNSSGAAEDAFKKMTGGLGMSFRQAKASVNDLLIAIGSALAPKIVDMIAWFQQTVKSIGDWISQNKSAVLVALKLGAALLGVGAASIVLDTGLRLIAVPLGILRAGFSLLGIGLSLVLGPFKLFGFLLKALPFIIVAVLHPITAMLSLLSGIGPLFGAAFKAAALAVSLLLNPVTLIIAGIAALGVAALAAMGLFSRALKNIGYFFSQIAGDAKVAFGAIAEALASGDIIRATKILWATLKMWFEMGWMELKRLWLDFCGAFDSIGIEAFHNLLKAAEYVWYAIERGLIALTNFLSDIWHDFINLILESWNWVGNKLSKLWNWMKSQFSDSFDAEAANKEADAYYNRKKAEIEKEVRLRENAHRREIELAEQAHKTTLAFIERSNQKKAEAIERDIQRKLAANKQYIAQLRSEWKALADITQREMAAATKGTILDPTTWTPLAGTLKPGAAGAGLPAANAPKQEQVLPEYLEEIGRTRKIAEIQGGGVNLKEDERQRLLQAYNQLSIMPGFSKQSAEAEDLRTKIEALQTPMQAFIGQLQAIPPMWQQIGSLMYETFNTVSAGVGNMIAQALIYQQDIGQMGLALLKQVGAQVIATLIQIGIQALASLLITGGAFTLELIGKMGGYAAMTYAAAYAANVGNVPWFGPLIAAGIAAGAVATMLAGAVSAHASGSAAGLSMSYDKGGISLNPQLAAVSGRGQPELHLTRPSIRRYFPEMFSGGGDLYITIDSILDGDRVARSQVRRIPRALRRQGIAGF